VDVLVLIDARCLVVILGHLLGKPPEQGFPDDTAILHDFSFDLICVLFEALDSEQAGGQPLVHRVEVHDEDDAGEDGVEGTK